MLGLHQEPARCDQFGVFAFLRKLGWQKSGPVREVYLVNPGSVASYGELLAEVQVPWSQGG